MILYRIVSLGYVVTNYFRLCIRCNRRKISDCHFTVMDVLENKEYEFRVSAENRAGNGPPTDSTGLIKISDPIGSQILHFHPSLNLFF